MLSPCHDLYRRTYQLRQNYLYNQQFWDMTVIFNSWLKVACYSRWRIFYITDKNFYCVATVAHFYSYRVTIVVFPSRTSRGDVSFWLPYLYLKLNSLANYNPYWKKKAIEKLSNICWCYIVMSHLSIYSQKICAVLCINVVRLSKKY